MENKDVIEALAKKLWGENKEVATELANVIFKLRDEPEFEYPIFKKSIYYGSIVKFSSLLTREIIVQGYSRYEVGTLVTNSNAHTNGEVWIDVPYNKERGLYHGQPVECMDHTYTHSRALRFYDAINKCVFTTDGELNGSYYTHIEAIPSEHIPDWMYEAYKTLEGI